MAKVDEAKKVVSRYIDGARHGIFNTRNFVGDVMCNVYRKDGLVIDICPFWEYFEVFGLSDGEFVELREFYRTLLRDQEVQDG